MLILDFASDLATGDQLGFSKGSWLFEAAHQTGCQSPEAQDCLSRDPLVRVTAQQVFVILLEERLDLPTNGQDIDESLCLQIVAGNEQ